MENIKNLRPFSKFCMTIGELPSSYTVSLTYEEQLLWLCNYIEKTVIPTVNNNADAVIELQELYKQLKSYVDNYFTNLDVQEEINNKLDAMAEDGTLDRIINQNIFAELNNKINNAENNITNLINSQNPIDFYKGKNLVVFGDSFSQPNIPNSENAHWVERVRLATGMTPFNFAIAGAGFAREENKMSSQLTTALNTMTQTEKDNTSVVIVYGGYNDLLQNLEIDNIIIEASYFIRNIANNFTNAKIIFAPFNWGFGSLRENTESDICFMINSIKRNNSFIPVVYLSLARFWILGIPTYFRNESHPSQSGYNVIASQFINAIYGGSEHCEFTFNPVWLHGENRFVQFAYNDGLIKFRFNCTFQNDLDNYNGTMFNLHPLFTPFKDIVLPIYNNVGEMKGSLILSALGTCDIKINNYIANEYIFTTPISFMANANVNWSST